MHNVIGLQRSGRPRTKKNMKIVVQTFVQSSFKSNELGILQHSLHTLYLKPFRPKLNENKYDRQMEFCELHLIMHDNDDT
jgi:hypothetical protein